MSDLRITDPPWRLEPKSHEMFDIVSGPNYFDKTIVGFTAVLPDGASGTAEANGKAFAAVPAMLEALRLVAPHGRRLQHGPNVSISADAYDKVLLALEAAGVEL